MRIVLDTNVLVSGLINPFGAPGRILDLLLDGKISLLYDDRILAEYREVLERSRLGIQQPLAQALIGYIRLSGERISAIPLPVDSLPDPDDIAFVEIALAGAADALVTGNIRHFEAAEALDIHIVPPADFLKTLQL